MSDEENQEQEIKVIDRRRFNSDGDLLPGAEDRPDQSPAEKAPAPPPVSSPIPDAPKPPSSSGESGPGADPKPQPNISGMTFEHLVMSLSTTALLQMGMVEDPEAGHLPPDLPAARQTVDLLGVVMEKTRGNLTGKEQALLEQVLAELRMAYVRLTGDVEQAHPPAAG